MKREEAARKSLVCVAVREKDNGTLLFWYQDATWTQLVTGEVQQMELTHPSPYDDWKPLLMDGSREALTWVHRYGQPREPQWQRMMALSPVGLVFRSESDGCAMVRIPNGQTWIEVPSRSAMVCTDEEFRHYNGWTFISVTHPLAKGDYTKAEFPYPPKKERSILLLNLLAWLLAPKSPSTWGKEQILITAMSDDHLMNALHLTERQLELWSALHREARRRSLRS